MLRMKNIMGEVRELFAAVSNRVPKEERMQQKSGYKSPPSRSMLRMNNSSPEMGWGGGMGRKKTGAKIKDSNAAIQDSGN